MTMKPVSIFIDDEDINDSFISSNSIFKYKQDLTRRVNTSSNVCIECDTQLKEFIKQLDRPNRIITPVELY